MKKDFRSFVVKLTMLAVVVTTMFPLPVHATSNIVASAGSPVEINAVTESIQRSRSLRRWLSPLRLPPGMFLSSS